MNRNLAARAGHWSATHRKKAIFGWLAFVLIATVLGGSVGMRTLSRRGRRQRPVAGRRPRDRRRRASPTRPGEQVLVQAGRQLRPRSSRRSRVRDVASAAASAVPHVRNVESPFAEGNEGQISRTAAPSSLTFDIVGDEDQVQERVDPTLAAVKAGAAGPPGPARRAVRRRVERQGPRYLMADDFKKARRCRCRSRSRSCCSPSGALVAAGLPLCSASPPWRGRSGLLGPLSQLFPLDDAVSSVVLLIGLAVGVDYSMFYLRREMEERDAGRSPQQALEIAAATSGRAVLVSGLTVMIAMGGMFLAGNATFVSFAIGTILVVAVAVLGSLTFLRRCSPGWARRAGRRRGRVPWVGRRRHKNNGESALWARSSTVVLRRPLVAAVAATALLMRPGDPGARLEDVRSGRAGDPARRAGDADLRPHPGRVPGRPLPGVGRRAGRRRHRAAGPARHRRAARAASPPGRCPSRSTSRQPDRRWRSSASRCRGTGTDAASTRARRAARRGRSRDDRRGRRRRGRRDRA
jgi:RND superfamily putative drug exporter